MKDFIKKILKENEVVIADYNFVIDKIHSELKKSKIKADVVLGGSVAKGTFLKQYDLDIFVQFHKDPNSNILEKVLKKVFKKFERLHGSRDYFKIIYKNQNYEIVPVLKIKKPEQAANVTDVSMLHVEWVKKHLKKPEHVKLAKLFCKSQQVYGAESYINGFSGYILEILTVYYGGFEKFIEAVSKWRPKTIIDVAKYYKPATKALNELNKSKTTGPLVVIDPVQKDRNAAAAVGYGKYFKLIGAANRYLEKPSIDFFIKTKFSIEKLKKECEKQRATLSVLKVEPLQGKEDVVGAKMLKVFNHMKKEIRKNGFNIFKAEFEYDDNYFWFMSLPKKLSATKVQKGPSLNVNKEDIKKFKKKYKKIKIEDDRLYAVIKRKYTTVDPLIKNLIKDVYVKERVKKIKRIKC